jgi:MFS family permease
MGPPPGLPPPGRPLTRASRRFLATSRSLRSLDLLNFFIADAQTGFGPFIAVYLTAMKWTQVEIGFALTLGTVTALISQVPAGAMVDALHRKRAAAAFGIFSITASAVLLALFPSKLPVYVAEILHGFASCVLTPSVAAVSLRLVGRAALGERLGRNARYASIGNGIAAAVMGAIGSYVSSASVFWLTAALGVPALVALWFVQPARPEIRTRTVRPFEWAGLRNLFADRRLQVFCACTLLFHLSNAAMLPLAGADATKQAGEFANLIIAACIVVPQIVVALFSPWVGQAADEHGRRAMLVLGWGALPIRGVLLALLPDPYWLIAIQILSGVSAAVFGVMLPLIAADLTRGTGRFNLCLGVIGLAIFVGASLSTTLAGWIADTFGDSTAFMALALAGACGTALLWRAMPDTRIGERELATATPGRGRGR